MVSNGGIYEFYYLLQETFDILLRGSGQNIAERLHQ